MSTTTTPPAPTPEESRQALAQFLQAMTDPEVVLLWQLLQSVYALRALAPPPRSDG
jgi:hypothetical protein